MDLTTLAKLTYNALIVSMIVNTAIALYGIFAKPNLIKKIIALTIFSDTVNTFSIIVGYRVTEKLEQSIPPVVTEIPPSKEYLEYLAKHAVDPLPQALVLTAIVISLAVIAFLLGLAIQIYRVSGTVDVRKLVEIKAREVE